MNDAYLTLPQMLLRDPWMVTDYGSGLYHLYSTNYPDMTGSGDIGAMVYTSSDLVYWTAPRMVFSLPAGIWANAGGWAPEVHWYRNLWWMCITLHNADLPLPSGRPGRIRRGTALAVSSSLAGPFHLTNNGEPVTPPGRMTLDGTLHVNRLGRAWFVYSHEWQQTSIGTIEAIPLDENLQAAGSARLLFSAQDATWSTGKVTDGPEIYRTRTDRLLMLWSSWAPDGYVQSMARSLSGYITGPWEQLPPLVRSDSGHGMLFETFNGTLMMVLHRPFFDSRGKLYEMRDVGNRVEVAQHRTDLDGDPAGTP